MPTDWLNIEEARFRDDPKGTSYPWVWMERPCLRGMSCANSTWMQTCDAGTWCPRGNAGPLTCDPLSSCPPRSYFQVNFIAPVIAAALTVLTVGVSAWLVLRQRAAAARCRAAGAKGILRDLPPAAAPDAPAPSPTTENGGGGLDFEFTRLTLSAAGGRELLTDVTGRVPAGRLTALVGPSGAGKTVLLSALAGGSHTTITSGELAVNGATLGGAGSSPAAFAARLGGLVGFVPRGACRRGRGAAPAAAGTEPGFPPHYAHRPPPSIP